MNAQEKFTIGQRVQFNGAARRTWPRTNAQITCPHIATVKYYGRDGTSVGVLFDGHKSPQVYHIDFLERASAASSLSSPSATDDKDEDYPDDQDSTLEP